MSNYHVMDGNETRYCILLTRIHGIDHSENKPETRFRRTLGVKLLPSFGTKGGEVLFPDLHLNDIAHLDV